MKCKLGFSQTEDGQLLVVTEVLGPEASHAGLSVTRFSDEGLFLSRMVIAELDPEVTTSIISHILLVMAGRPEHAGWTTLEITQRQLHSMGLSLPLQSGATSIVPMTLLPGAEELRDVLMQAPLPVTLLAGPQHEFAFINPSYVHLLGRSCAESLLGRTVRDALPELEGQGFFRLLNQVYKTGKPYVGTEVQGFLRREADGRTEEHYFDFVYHPARDRAGQTYGILCIATDVTERVLARQVSEARELQLYRQWAELEAIYRGAPVGMALVDTREYRLLRINDANAKLLGVSADDLVGRKISDQFPGFCGLRKIYERVASGEEIRNVQLHLVGSDPNAPVRKLLVSFSPVLDACGLVEAIASITIDYAEILRVQPEIALRLNTSGLAPQVVTAPLQ